MGHTILPSELATGGAVVDTGMTAVTDAEFTTRNSHFIFTEDYRLRCCVGMGATITRLNFFVPTWNAYTLQNVWPLMLSSANITSPPRTAWFNGSLPIIPQNEEIQLNVTDGASENAAAFMIIQTPNLSMNLPAGQQTINVRATCAITQVANAWAGPGALTFQQNLRGGVYSIIGGQVVGSGTAAWRLIFPRSRFYMGRRLRPGWIAQQAIGDLPDPLMQGNEFVFGEWGRFHTFEPPQLEVYSIAGTSAITHELRLWMVYLGQDEPSLLDSWVAQGWT